MSCDGCGSSSREGGGTGFIKLGGTLSDKVLLGGEINAWTKSDSGVTAELGNVSFAAYLYPQPKSGFFVKGGVGFATTRFHDGGTIEATGFGFLMGVGYDIRVGTNISITPVGNFYLGFDGDLKSGGTTLLTGSSTTCTTSGWGSRFTNETSFTLASGLPLAGRGTLVGMKRNQRQWGTRRLVGALVVAGIAVAFAVPAPAVAHHRSHECHHAASIPASSLPSGGGCDHGPGSPCAAMLDCQGTAPALIGAPIGAPLQSPVVASVAASGQALHRRLTLGPPPPPPNS